MSARSVKIGYTNWDAVKCEKKILVILNLIEKTI